MEMDRRTDTMTEKKNELILHAYIHVFTYLNIYIANSTKLIVSVFRYAGTRTDANFRELCESYYLLTLSIDNK